MLPAADADEAPVVDTTMAEVADVPAAIAGRDEPPSSKSKISEVDSESCFFICSPIREILFVGREEDKKS